MTDSIREKIAQRLTVLAGNIQKANGYETDIGKNTHRARRSFDEDDLPASSLWLGDETSERHISSKQQDMTISFDGHHQLVKGKTADAVCNMMIADLSKAMEAYDAELYTLIDGIGYNGATPEYPEDGQDLCSVSVSFTVTYTTKRGDPYTRP